MRVLITGSSGHVGGAIVRHLVERRYDVAGVSRRASSDLPAQVRQISLDIASAGFVETVRQAVDPCDVIVHAAAEIDMRPDARAVTLTNGLGTQQVLQLAELWGVKSFVYVSSVPVIGMPRMLPITEDHPAAPRTAYHASKLYGEHLTAIARANRLPAATLRLTSPVGPGMSKRRILAVFAERARQGLPLELNGKGTRRQNYVDVRDVAQAVERCLEEDVSGLFNIAGVEAVSNLELAERCIGAFKSASEIVFSGVPDPDDDVVWDVSVVAARKTFGYVPACSLEDSIRAVE